METIEYTGSAFLPAKLAREINAAGIESYVTCTEADGAITAVQCLCPDGTARAALDPIVAAHVPEWP